MQLPCRAAQPLAARLVTFAALHRPLQLGGFFCSSADPCSSNGSTKVCGDRMIRLHYLVTSKSWGKKKYIEYFMLPKNRQPGRSSRPPPRVVHYSPPVKVWPLVTPPHPSPNPPTRPLCSRTGDPSPWTPSCVATCAGRHSTQWWASRCARGR